jgi:hypothetical protein
VIVTRFFVAARGRGVAWFRLFGVGLAWSDHRVFGPLISERYAGRHGFRRRRFLHLGPWCFMVTTERHP